MLDADHAPVLIDQVVTDLEQLIMSGQFRPGEKLREQSLAEKLGVSRGPLREAIRTLEGRRLLERTPHSGVQVIGVSVDDLDHLLQTREALEGLAARQAARTMSVGDIDRLRRTLQRHNCRPQLVAEAVYNSNDENDFHRLIAHGSANRWLIGMLVHDVYCLLRLYRFHCAMEERELAISLAEHQLIVDRIGARDAEGAEAVMKAHIRGIRERTLERVTAGSRAGARPASTPRRKARQA